MYRAWDKLSKKMLTGEQLIEMGIYISPANENLIFVDNPEFNLMKYLILMKDIGLKDKNRKEIYEGDIVKGKLIFQREYLTTQGIIEYSSEFAAYGLRNACLTLFHNHDIKTFEIIGNIHENPKLLERKKKK